jgi:nucleoside 2-deoxyribosyltransferase
MHFYEQMDSIGRQLEDIGFTVTIPAPEEVKIDCSATSDEELGRVKNKFIDQHLVKIRRADAILVANLEKRGVSGYVGANTLMEAAFAYALGKRIYLLHPPGEQSCRPELLGMAPEVIDGELKRLSGGSSPGK